MSTGTSELENPYSKLSPLRFRERHFLRDGAVDTKENERIGVNISEYFDRSKHALPSLTTDRPLMHRILLSPPLLTQPFVSFGRAGQFNTTPPPNRHTSSEPPTRVIIMTKNFSPPPLSASDGRSLGFYLSSFYYYLGL